MNTENETQPQEDHLDETAQFERAEPQTGSNQDEPIIEESLEPESEDSLESQIQVLEDRLARTQAELLNSQKRSRNELAQFRKYEGIDLIRNLLPVIDNLERALQAAEQSSNVEDLKTGVDMVLNQFLEILKSQNVQAIASEGESFDPNIHEAVQQLPSEEFAAMTVMNSLETGYQLHDRVIRPAKVIVSTGPTQSESTDS